MTKTGSIMLLTLILAVLDGCTTKKYYEGEPRDRAEVAIVKGDFSFSSWVLVHIDKVDRQKSGIFTEYAEVLPGEHMLDVRCEHYLPIAIKSSYYKTQLMVNVEAGRTYVLMWVDDSDHQCQVELIEEKSDT